MCTRRGPRSQTPAMPSLQTHTRVHACAHGHAHTHTPAHVPTHIQAHVPVFSQSTASCTHDPLGYPVPAYGPYPMVPFSHSPYTLPVAPYPPIQVCPRNTPLHLRPPIYGQCPLNRPTCPRWGSKPTAPPTSLMGLGPPQPTPSLAPTAPIAALDSPLASACFPPQLFWVFVLHAPISLPCLAPFVYYWALGPLLLPRDDPKCLT